MTFGQRRIWVVDDEPDVLAYLLAALEDADYAPRGFACAEELMATLKEPARPDLLCLDILLPEVSGLSLFRALRQAPGWMGIPIVMVSGYSRREEFEAGELQRLMGDDSFPPPDGFVEKPVNLPDFLGLIARLLGPSEGLAQKGAGEGMP